MRCLKIRLYVPHIVPLPGKAGEIQRAGTWNVPSFLTYRPFDITVRDPKEDSYRE